MNRCLRCAREIPEAGTLCDECGQHSADRSGPVLVIGASSRQESADANAAAPADVQGQQPVVIVTPPPAMPPPPAQPPLARALASRRELVIALAAFVVAGIGTLGFLSASSASRGDAMSATEARKPTASTSPRSVATPKWNSGNRYWTGNQRHAIAFELSANNKVHVWQRDAQPVLVVRCQSKRTDAFVYIESAAKLEPRDQNHTVHVRFDDGPDTSERWPDSDEHVALFAPDGAAFAHRIIAARTLRFGYTPHNAEPVVAEFNVSGLSELIEPAARQCGWKK